MMTTFIGTLFGEDDSLKITILWTLNTTNFVPCFQMSNDLLLLSDQYNNNVDTNDLGAN